MFLYLGWFFCDFLKLEIGVFGGVWNGVSGYCWCWDSLVLGVICKLLYELFEYDLYVNLWYCGGDGEG